MAPALGGTPTTPAIGSLTNTAITRQSGTRRIVLLSATCLNMNESSSLARRCRSTPLGSRSSERRSWRPPGSCSARRSSSRGSRARSGTSAPATTRSTAWTCRPCARSTRPSQRRPRRSRARPSRRCGGTPVPFRELAVPQARSMMPGGLAARGLTVCWQRYRCPGVGFTHSQLGCSMCGPTGAVAAGALRGAVQVADREAQDRGGGQSEVAEGRCLCRRVTGRAVCFPVERLVPCSATQAPHRTVSAACTLTRSCCPLIDSVSQSRGVLCGQFP